MSQHNNLIYLDYAATTPVAKSVAAKMSEYLTVDGIFGNPASRSHGYGWQAEEAVETARQQVLKSLMLIHAKSSLPLVQQNQTT